MNALSLLIIAAAVFVIVLTSYGLAQFLKMKRAQLPWVIVSWGVAIAAAYAMYAEGLAYLKVDGLAVFAVGLGTLFLMFVGVLRSGVLGALTLMIASFAVGVLLLGGGYFALGKSEKNDVLNTVASWMPKSEIVDLDFTPKVPVVSEVEEVEDEFYSENDLLPVGAVKAKDMVLTRRSYQEIGAEQVGRFKGYKVRITKRDNRVLKGMIIGKQNNRIVISQYLAEGNGLIEAPVKFASIQKIEVFR